ncbi:hypothetical protein F4777DRAFT_575686 [Nemania sp. FL0916]|nr:hypothetical protein F4777DRAFT_575686 [Nemania sp. FL0916]
MAKNFAILLALVGAALAHMHGMGKDTNSSSVLSHTTSVAENREVVVTVTPQSTITVTTTLATSNKTALRKPNSSHHNLLDGSSPPFHNHSGQAVTAVATGTAAMAPFLHFPTGSMTIMNVGSMGTGGMSMPNATAAASQPIVGNGVVNSVSVGLFLVSVGLTALLQM